MPNFFLLSLALSLYPCFCSLYVYDIVLIKWHERQDEVMNKGTSRSDATLLRCSARFDCRCMTCLTNQRADQSHTHYYHTQMQNKILFTKWHTDINKDSIPIKPPPTLCRLDICRCLTKVSLARNALLHNKQVKFDQSTKPSSLSCDDDMVGAA